MRIGADLLISAQLHAAACVDFSATRNRDWLKSNSAGSDSVA
jgi:hypothetical protein